MTTFETNIKKWVNIDNKIKQLSNEIKILREEKNSIKQDIYKYVDEKNLSNVVIKISDGSLKFNKYKCSSPLTYKYLEFCLSRCIDNNEKVNTIMQYIKQSRECKYIDDIKRFYY